METLRNLLRQENILSEDGLRLYIEQNYSDQSKIPFTIYKPSDLNLDDESRIYDDKIEYERAIFEVPRLRIANSRRISFTNCIFLGEINIGQKGNKFENLYMDYCIIGGPLTITGLDRLDSATFVSINCPEMNLFNSKIRRISINSCRIGRLFVDECELADLSTFCNVIQYLDIGRNNFGKVSFNHSQVPIFEQPPQHDAKRIGRIIDRFDIFRFPTSPDLDALSKVQKQATRNQTFQFFMQHTDVKLSRDAYAQVKYLEAISSQDNAVLRLIYRACGALLKPSRILALILLTIVAFGLVFHLQAFQFNTLGKSGQVVRQSLDWGEAMYYSGISFTTIGYGDITPLGWARAAAIMEGLLGIVLASSFLVSLLRRYAE